VIARLGSGGTLCIYNLAATHLIVDVAGYLTGSAPSPPGASCPGDVKNCTDFATYADAKAYFDFYYPYYGDVAHLDADGDRIPCETLPGHP
jgi:hypothetical protein